MGDKEYRPPRFWACGALQIKAFSRLNCPQQTSFSVHFLFSAACELWRRSRGSISPGWTSGRTLCRRPHSVLAPYPGKSPLPASRLAARPTSGTTYSRPRKKWSGGRCGCPHRQERCSCRPHSSSTSGVSGWPPVSSAPVSCGKGNRPACALWAAVVYMGYLSCVPSISLLPFAPKRLPAPFLRRVPALARSPQLRDKLSRSDLWTKCPEIGSLRCFPCRGIPFRTVIWFSRCSSSMNYPKSTPKRQPVPYIRKVGNPPKKLPISTLSELW